MTYSNDESKDSFKHAPSWSKNYFHIDLMICEGMSSFRVVNAELFDIPGRVSDFESHALCPLTSWKL